MININFTLVVQLANFLILLIILNVLLFRPILRVLDERERLVRESSQIRDRLGSLADEGIKKYEKEILEAKQKAMSMRTSVRSDVMATFRKEVQEAKGASLAELEEARQSISAEAESTRKVLMEEAESLAEDIAGKLLGRPVQRRAS